VLVGGISERRQKEFTNTGHIDELPDPDELLGADHEAEFLPPQHKSKISPSVQGLSSGFPSLGVEEQNDLLPW